MIERKPFTPEDYIIGREGATKGTSDYPTKGTAPRDALHMDSEGKKRRNVIARGRIDRSEPLSEALNPEEALIEAEERHLREGRQEGVQGRGSSEEVEVGTEAGHGLDNVVAQDEGELSLKPRNRSKIVPGISKMGIGRGSRVEHSYELNKEVRPSKKYGSQKPRDKEHRRQSRVS